MDGTTIRQEILRELDYLQPELQRRVLDFAHALVVSCPKGVRGKELLRFAGCFQAEDMQAMSQAIEAGCERVDVNGW